MSGRRQMTESDKRCLEVRNQIDALLEPLSREERLSVLVRVAIAQDLAVHPTAAKKDGGAMSEPVFPHANFSHRKPKGERRWRFIKAWTDGKATLALTAETDGKETLFNFYPTRLKEVKKLREGRLIYRRPPVGDEE